MSRLLRILLILSIAFSTLGCTTTRYVYIEPTCPKIEVLETVPKIQGRVGPDGCLRGDQLKELFKGAKMLRKSENYYREQITKYNQEFVDK